jgi:hypothetical protein
VSRVATFVNIEMEILKKHLHEVLADTRKRVVRMSNSPQNDSADRLAIERALRDIDNVVDEL